MKYGPCVLWLYTDFLVNPFRLGPLPELLPAPTAILALIYLYLYLCKGGCNRHDRLYWGVNSVRMFMVSQPMFCLWAVGSLGKTVMIQE